MKILFIMPGGILGGAELRTFRLCEKFKKMGYDAIVASGKGPCITKLKEAGMPYIELPIYYDNLSFFSAVRSFFILAKYIKKNEIQILVTYRRGVSLLVSILNKVVHAIHVYMHVNVFETKLWLRFKSDYTIAISKACYDNAINYLKIPKHQCKIIYRGVDVPEGVINKPTSRERLQIDKKQIVVGTSSRLSNEKGIEYLIRSMPMVYKKYDNVVFLIAGDGPNLKKLKDLSGSLIKTTKNIKFLGWKDDIWDILPAFDIFVNPSVSAEGLSNSLIEAAACGIPLIGTAIGGIPDVVVNGINGLLVPPADINALSEAIMFLVDNGDERVRMGNQSRQLVAEKFSSEREVNEHLALYESLLRKTA